MPFAQPGDISAVLNSFAMRGQSEAERRNRDLQAAAERRAGMAALGGVLGSVGGAYLGGPLGGAVGGALGARLMGGRQTGLAPVATAAGQGFQMGQAQSAYEQAQADKAAQGRVLEAVQPRIPESAQAQQAYDDVSALLGRGPGQVNVAENTVTEGEPSLALGQRPEVSPQDAALAERNRTLRGILENAKGSSQPLQTAAQGMSLLGAANPAPKDMIEKEIIRDGKTYIQPYARTPEGLQPLGPPVLKSESSGERANQDPYFPGTGLDVSATRNINNIAPKIKKGTATEAEIEAYTTSYNQLSTPSVFQDSSGNQMIRPAKDLARFPQPPGEAQQTQPAQAGGGTPAGAGYPAGTRQVDTKPLPVEQAAKLAMVEGAIKTHAGVRQALTTPTGFDRTTIAAMNANLPFTEGRALRQQMKDAIEARLRAESGAAVPDNEVERAMDRFMPSSIDSNSAIQSKFDRFEAWLKSTSWMAREGRAPRPPDAPKAKTTGNLPKLKTKYGLE